MGSPEEVGGGEWRVYTAEGRDLGVTRFPPGFQPRIYREGRYYGVHADALGVQRVVRLEVSSR